MHSENFILRDPKLTITSIPENLASSQQTISLSIILELPKRTIPMEEPTIAVSIFPTIISQVQRSTETEDRSSIRRAINGLFMLISFQREFHAFVDREEERFKVRIGHPFLVRVPGRGSEPA